VLAVFGISELRCTEMGLNTGSLIQILLVQENNRQRRPHYAGFGKGVEMVKSVK